jgi:hypothetical protein
VAGGLRGGAQPPTTDPETLRHVPDARVGTALAPWAVRGGRRIGRGDLRPSVIMDTRPEPTRGPQHAHSSRPRTIHHIAVAIWPYHGL